MTEEKLLSVSWSKIKTYEHCKQKAHLQSKGFKNPSANVRVFFRGTVTDRVLREWIQDPNRELGQMSSMVDEYIELCEQEHKTKGTGIVRWKSPTDKTESSEWCKELLTTLEPIMQEMVLPYVPHVSADKYYKARVTIPGLDGEPRDIQMVGILDILIDSPDFLAIYDLKATEDESYWKKTIMQLVFYHIIIQSATGRTPNATALIQPKCVEQVKFLEITQQHELNLMEKVISYAHSVWREDFAPKESDAGCLNWCEFKNSCEKFNKKDESGRLSWI